LNKQIVGVEPSFGDLRAHYADPGGRFIDELDQRYKRRVIFLGDKLKTELFADQPALGKTVLINQTPFTVIGVMHKKQQNNMYGGPDNDHAAIPESTFELMFGRQYLSDMVLKPKHPDQMALLKSDLRETLGRKYRFDPTDDRALPMWDTQHSQKITNNILLGIEIFLGMIGALTLIIGGVGVANIMYAVVRHRSRDIAIQMALGAKRSFVMGPLVLEALTLTSFGGALGIAVGVVIQQGLAYIQRGSTNQALELLGAPTFSWAVALTTVALLGLIGLAAGYFPARRAVTVQPAVVLRDE
ncbi:MAG TPA: ABC transporter permease, partial [Thermoanaerobaculia bacterium]|nr:ABC transporter permease [Thermoanaerobaculia bacterium]